MLKNCDFELKKAVSYTKIWNPTLSSNTDVQRAQRGQCRKCRIKLKIKFFVTQEGMLISAEDSVGIRWATDRGAWCSNG